MADVPKKVLHIITTASVGGAEMMLYRLLQRNDPDRYAPSILSLMPPTSMKDLTQTWIGDG